LRIGIEYTCHLLWAVITTFLFISVIVECHSPHNFWVTQIRIFFFLAQGTWLMQIAFVIWPQTTNPMFLWPNDMNSFTWLVISLMYHFFFSAIVLTFMHVFVHSTIGCYNKAYDNFEMDLNQTKHPLYISNNDFININNNNIKNDDDLKLFKNGLENNKIFYNSEKEYSILLNSNNDEDELEV
jgi:hypothetical protein